MDERFAGVLRALGTGAADEAKPSPAEQEIVKVSQARRDAANKRDMKALARFMVEECVLSTDGGVLVTKAQYLEELGKLPTEYDHTMNAREHVVHIYGNTAVINYRISGHEQFTDADIASEQRRTETWLKKDGTWLLIAVQWDNLPVNFRKPVAVDAKVLKDYAGEYELRPGADIETVFVKDSKLMTQIGKDVTEYLPAGGDSFFIREGDLATFTFSRDAQGHVTGYVYHRIDGQEIRARKVK